METCKYLGLLLLSAASALSASAAVPEPSGQEAAPANSQPAERLPEEITVTGQKLFSTLHNQIRDAEDRLYGLFNELNPDNLYDIHCVWEAPLGTRIRKRNCRPEFVDRATRDEAQNFLAQMQGAGAANPTPVMAQLAFHYPILQAKMKALVQEHPELFDAVLRLTQLHQELDTRKTAYFSDD